ncbi:hypothetical protein QYF61_021609 [Mycteria americana]|uniref:Uncharacterized protein n=1 Tax=Mycteria americana TaxID=33587 RepID=A0AAN7NV87_MYCAM|nr:hypothetical protein QYF61_021609 [Mycteria americana]
MSKKSAKELKTWGDIMSMIQRARDERATWQAARIVLFQREEKESQTEGQERGVVEEADTDGDLSDENGEAGREELDIVTAEPDGRDIHGAYPVQRPVAAAPVEPSAPPKEETPP